MVTVGLVVELHAAAGKEDALQQFLTDAVELANQEEGTPVWLALKTDASTFWIVDAFPGDTERQAHLEGPIAAALLDKADELLSEAPQISPAEVLASKM